MKAFAITVVVLALLVGAFAGLALAQGFMELDPIVVEGQIQRPQAAYIIQRATMEFGLQAKRMSFVNLIENSIEEEPF
ncbi:MAG TPA: hypothetical protein PKW95_18365 [bacterium]|nr:hypothetical protein [bacterium]